MRDVLVSSTYTVTFRSFNTVGSGNNSRFNQTFRLYTNSEAINKIVSLGVAATLHYLCIAIRPTNHATVAVRYSFYSHLFMYSRNIIYGS